MSYKPTYIADLQSGLVRDKESFLIPQDAFPELTNAYIWRGRIKRRDGCQKLARLQRDIVAFADGGTYSTINGTNTYSIFGQFGIALTEPNASLVIPSIANPIGVSFAAPISNAIVFNDATGNGFIFGAGPITAATINFTTGIVTITASAAAGPAIGTLTFSYYPTLPVMSLSEREITQTNSEDLVAFDTKYSYIFNAATNQFEEWIPGTTWQGGDADFFWTTNYWQTAAGIGLFWECNNNSGVTGDPIRYTDGVTWTTFNPILHPDATATPPRLQEALILLPFKDRLLAFNTWEGASLAAAVQYPQRVRWSQNGDPTVLGTIAGGAPFGWTTVGAWSDDTPGKGGFLDAPTNEFIISVAYLRDVLIVGFERSTWQLRYTGNEILPFVWEKINSDLGVESTFSAVQLDDVALGVGNFAIQACNGNASNRIDLQIPDEVFSFHNENNGPIRVHGIRDFYKELVYWTFPNDTTNGVFPNRMLVYNYRNNTYAFFDESYTCFSEWQTTKDREWQDYINNPVDQWQYQPYPWNNPTNQSRMPVIVAGNQVGYVFVLNQLNDNGPSLPINAIAGATPWALTVPNHNLADGDFVTLNGALGTIQGVFDGIAGSINSRTYKVRVVDADHIRLFYWSALNQQFQGFIAIGNYLGGGELAFQNVINIRSKKFNALNSGVSIKLGYVDILADVTSSGQFEFNIYSDYNDSQPINTTGDDFFNSIVSTQNEQFQMQGQSKCWHRSFCPMRSQFYQFQITQNEQQLVDQAIANSGLVIHALILWAEEGGRLV